MNSYKFNIYFTTFVSLAIFSLLAYSYMHGGVPSHHILNDASLPKISNWWGALVLPVLTWMVLYRIQSRENLARLNFKNMPKKVIYGFLIALLLGFSIAISFSFDSEEIPGYLLFLIIISSLFYPIYRAECLLGFVLSMTFTFGAVLPTCIGLILMCIGFGVYQLVVIIKKLLFKSPN